MENKNILIICSSKFGLPSMREMVYANQLAVVGIPDHCTEILEEVSMILSSYNIPIIVLSKVNYEYQINQAIEEYQIRLCFVLTFSYKIPASLYDHPSLIGFFNVHSGPLPEYRGADPIFQQIKQREKLPGVTIHKLSEKMDAGNIVIQEKIFADFGDTHGILTTKLAELASRLTSIVIRMVNLNIDIPSRIQDENKSRYFKKQMARDITVDWHNMESKEIIALINACNPWNKGAVTRLNHKIIRILFAEETTYEALNTDVMSPGTILSFHGEEVIVSTINNGFLSIQWIYIDEGFFKASVLKNLGFFAGNTFSAVE